MPLVGPAALRQPFELQAGEDVCQAAVTILLDPAGVEQIEARGKDDIANLDRDVLVFLREIDRSGWAELFTGLASAFLEECAIFTIDDGEFWHSLREGRHPERPLKTNVEYYSALVLDVAEIPPPLAPAMFACSRVAGWSAHILEQKRTGRLFRPSARYVGPAPRSLQPA